MTASVSVHLDDYVIAVLDALRSHWRGRMTVSLRHLRAGLFRIDDGDQPLLLVHSRQRLVQDVSCDALLVGFPGRFVPQRAYTVRWWADGRDRVETYFAHTWVHARLLCDAPEDATISEGQ